MTTRAMLAASAAAALLLTGCARRVPVSDLEDKGAHVGVVVVLENGETLNARLLSLSSDDMTVHVYYRIAGDVELRGTGSDVRVESRGEPVEGELLSVEREGPGDRIAIVRRTVAVEDVSTATFHRSGSEASLGSALSLFIGPVVGALLALAI